jgi:uncharacterized tellurite resistance protein B-like protein
MASVFKSIGSKIRHLLGLGSSSQPAGAARGRLGEWTQNLPSKLGLTQSGTTVPADFCQPLDMGALNCRVRIGREVEADSWRSVLIVEICGTIHAPDSGHEVAMRISLDDVTESTSEPLAIVNRPKHGPLNTSSFFVHQNDMGRLCRETTVLEDWTTVAQLEPSRFVLPRSGQRKLHYSVSIISKQTSDLLASASCTGAYENLDIGYLDIEENIQRAKTLAVGLAFSVGAANGKLLDPEVNVIDAWVKTNFGSADASEGARQELERALQKTATFFRRGGHIDVQQVCSEIIEIAPMAGRLEFLDLCLRIAAAKGQVTIVELKLLKDVSEWLGIDLNRLRVMVEKILPVEMHQTHDAEMVLGVTDKMSMEEARQQLTREYAKWSSRVISTDPAIRRQADQMIQLIADARTQYTSAKAS